VLNDVCADVLAEEVLREKRLIDLDEFSMEVVFLVFKHGTHGFTNDTPALNWIERIHSIINHHLCI
jgi:spore maturation protein CgeB